MTLLLTVPMIPTTLMAVSTHTILMVMALVPAPLKDITMEVAKNVPTIMDMLEVKEITMVKRVTVMLGTITALEKKDITMEVKLEVMLDTIMECPVKMAKLTMPMPLLPSWIVFVKVVLSMDLQLISWPIWIVNVQK